MKNIKKQFFFHKTQKHDLFISPKRKITVLEMSLKSSIMAKLDHQISRILIEVANSFWKQLLTSGVPDTSAQDKNLTNTFSGGGMYRL